tara:strand:- start:983 stop:1438 length:456 start_codon:yes stop_codon:yes gene_type:complete
MIKFLQLLLAPVLFSLPCSGSEFKDGIEEFVQGFSETYSEGDIDFFYVSTTLQKENKEYAYIYWMTGNILIIVDLPIDDNVDYWWYRNKAGIDLSKDLVATPDDIHSSTYLTDSIWVEERLKDCLSDGCKIIIKRGENRSVNTTTTTTTSP